VISYIYTDYNVHPHSSFSMTHNKLYRGATDWVELTTTTTTMVYV